jgi:hypothetical protein
MAHSAPSETVHDGPAELIARGEPPEGASLTDQETKTPGNERI